MKQGPLLILALTCLALLAFAGNSLLTRAALSQSLIGAGSFATIRLAAGALMLAALAGFTARRMLPRRADAPAILALFIYMAGFSFAYRALGAATGALILFASVQISIAGLAAWRGEAPTARQALGLCLAFGGLVWLLAPGVSAPPIAPALLMASAGAAWGGYTLIGRGSRDPLWANARAFLGAIPIAAALILLEPSSETSAAGIGLAIAAGALTSGLGYGLWFFVLPHLSVATAGGVQLLVPVLTAAGASLWLGESLSPRLLQASLAILGGIALTVRRPQTAPSGDQP